MIPSTGQPNTTARNNVNVLHKPKAQMKFQDGTEELMKQLGVLHRNHLKSFWQTEITKITPELLTEVQGCALKQEKQHWKKKGAKQDGDGINVGPDSKTILPKTLYRYAATQSHGPCHFSTGVVRLVEQTYTD